MTDFLGNELQINDEVIFIYSNTTGGKKLMKGVVDKIERGNIYIKGCHYSCYDIDPHKIESLNSALFYDDQVKVKSSSVYKI